MFFDGLFYFEVFCGMEHMKRCGADHVYDLFGTENMPLIV